MEEIRAEHHHHIDPVVEYKSAKFGMWLFLGTEVLLFGGLFATYAIYRAKYPDLFHEGHKELDVTFGSINTMILIFSSMTMAMGVSAIKKGKEKLLPIMLAITILCGLAFGVIKYFEYSAKFEHHIYPGTNIFFALYFMMTGLHMLHVFGGIAVLTVILVLSLMHKFSKEYNTPVEASGLYWHLVDLIWIYLFPLFYLIS